MRAPALIAQVLIAFVFAARALVGDAAALADRPHVAGIRFGVEPARTRVVIEADAALDYQLFTLAERADRLVVDLAPVDFALGGERLASGERAGEGDGLVAGYRYAQNSPETSRLVFDLAEPVAIRGHFVLPPTSGAPRHRLVIDLEPTDRASFERASGHRSERARSAPAAPAAPAARDNPGLRRVDGRFVVVIDPGHGGRDPGAIGGAGLHEADVNLAVALLLREILDRSSRYEVVMTRDDDRYLELSERVDIARETGADLFISLHADSSSSGASVRGASVYTLAERAEGRASTEILARENWLIDVDLSGRPAPVNEILIDLAQRDTQNQSAAFAQQLIPRIADVGPVLRNTHRSAGYYVLLAPDVPAVLFEMGFLSNPQDEALLASERHRRRLARAVADAIDDYYEQRARIMASR